MLLKECGPYFFDVRSSCLFVYCRQAGIFDQIFSPHSKNSIMEKRFLIKKFPTAAVFHCGVTRQTANRKEWLKRRPASITAMASPTSALTNESGLTKSTNWRNSTLTRSRSSLNLKPTTAVYTASFRLTPWRFNSRGKSATKPANLQLNVWLKCAKTALSKFSIN